MSKAVYQSSHAERLAALRQAMRTHDLDAYLVPRTDQYQNEELPASAERLAYLTGFTGSSGAAIILRDKAAVFSDGRYMLQIAAQTDASLFEVHNTRDLTMTDWLEQQLYPGARIGYDPWLFTGAGRERVEKARESRQAILVAGDNLVDAIWADRPPEPSAKAEPHRLEYAGKSAAEKRAEIAALLKHERIDATILTGPDSIAWLLNIRGHDVPYAPFALSYAIIDDIGKVALFIAPEKLSDELAEWLGPEVTLARPSEFILALDNLSGRRIGCDEARVAVAIIDRLTEAGAHIIVQTDPCLLPKACKNTTEIAGMRAAHRRDGVAVVQFLAWLDTAVQNNALCEIEAAEKLHEFRRASGVLKDLSFATISGAGPNSAIIHYRATEESNRRLSDGALYLIDSGGQYLDGTTDITRTIAIGPPSDEQRDRFTRVLKGHIALATARFPVGATGSQLDILARVSLWEIGVDYDHGTGHGVGAYLSVHEGPQRISAQPSGIALKPGMVLSNEPGYYKPGEYGIRIENLVLVTPVEIAGAERQMLGFETLTLAPIDRRLIKVSLLNSSERAWLDDYHARVAESLTPLLDDAAAAWLGQATRAL